MKIYFYLMNFRSGFLEELYNIPNMFAQCCFYIFSVWMFTVLWSGFNTQHNTFSFYELFIYVGLTEIIFLTAIRGSLIDASVEDFSILLTKPRFLPTYIASSIYSRQLSRRLTLLVSFLAFILLFIHNKSLAINSFLRFLLLLPILCIVETLYSFLMVCIQITLPETRYFRLAFTKILMIFGGVFSPLSDIADPLKRLLTSSPISDVIFQPCYFCLRGHFYEITSYQWGIRMTTQIVILMFFAFLIYFFAKRHHRKHGD